MPFLNYPQLSVFRANAHESSLTRVAARLNLSAPALRVKLRPLQEILDHALFERGGGGLKLTEAGRFTLNYAETRGRVGKYCASVR